MKALTKTTRQAVIAQSQRTIGASHPFGWQLGGDLCFGQSPKSSANSIMPTGNVVAEQLRSDYRLFEHR
jgi:hypothetical protein